MRSWARLDWYSFSVLSLDGLLEILFGLVKELEGRRAIGHYGVADCVDFLDGFCDGEVADLSSDCLT